MRRVLLVAALLAHAATARADSMVTVALNAEGEQLASELGLSIPDLIATAQARIDELYKVTRLGDLLHAFANTAAAAQRGLGVDYDPDSGDILIGAGGGGVHGDVAIGTTNSLLGGSIINVAAMTGVNLGRWSHPRWTVFANGFYESTTIHGLDGSLFTIGAHVQYHVLPATRPATLRWIGVAATTGLEHASWVVGTSTGGSIESHFTATGPDSHHTIHMSSTGTLDVTTSTVSVPIELTTGVRLFDTLVLYGGAGLDLTTGSSTVVAQLHSLLTINNDNIPIGTAEISGSGSSSPSAVTVHALVGLEIHTRHVRVVVQTAVAPGELAVNLGVRAAL